ncbi:lysozyme inhibitor LprI family protein [Acidisarcina polymorpha]|uniref:lysozyme inhibitor LprI family protein n=1 Tax=Acidisarcina polymorpha TaxID=2211140 RepID=UPI000DEF0832|nr:lysozyme inhibitor LprI family protein [Acidisarcina polymorpha]
MFAFRNCKAVSVMLLWTAVGLTAQDASRLGQADARLNQIYQERVAQLRNDSSAVSALRDQERGWIKERDAKCNKDVSCLAQATTARVDELQQQIAQNGSQTNAGSPKTSSPIPRQLWGKWTIGKVLPTQNVSCWDQKQANALVGTTLKYRADSFAWNGKTISNSGSTTSTVQRKDFAADNSGSAGSVDFHQLGINSTTVQQIEIQHPDASVYDKSAECCAAVPGETVMLTGQNSLVFGVCGVYYRASRTAQGKS